MEDFLKKARGMAAEDLSIAEALKLCCPGMERENDRRLLLAYIEGFHAADPATASMFWLDDVEDSDSAKEYEMRSRAGAGLAIDALFASIESRCAIHLSTTAHEIRWQRGEVAVATVRQDGERDVLRAASAIVTVPLPLLAGSADGFDFRIVPALSDKLRAAQKIEMGHVVKLVLHFREAFWRHSKVVKDFLFLHNPDQPFPTWWTGLDPEIPILTAWAGGPRALASAIRESPLDPALDSLAKILGWSRSAIDAQWVEAFYHDWSSDPYARGAYTYAAVGGIAAFEEIAQPVENTLFFAGEATCSGGMNATMEGALRSGSRAAQEILQTRAAAK
jgi:monoamine oxidase